MRKIKLEKKNMFLTVVERVKQYGIEIFLANRTIKKLTIEGFTAATSFELITNKVLAA